MDISGSYTLNAPREQVWDALLDPDLLKRAIPGCESLEQTGDNQYAMRLNVDVAGVKGAYQGTMRVLDAQKPESYRVVVDGAGARGILHSDGVLRLAANDAGATDIHYTGQAQLGGPVASIGAQVARGAASMLLKRYFGRIASLLPAVSAVPVADQVASVAAPVAASAGPEAPVPAAVAAPAEPPPTSAPADIPPTVADAAPTETFTIPSPASAVPGLYAPPPPAAPPPTPARSSTPAPAALSERSIETQRSSAGFIGVIVAILAVVVVVIVVLVVVGAFR
ncbi:MAG TPA: carbon monoxide dehydrogenase subunit G [Ktedonobacterales bacterium]|jgi:carbon monoxide dehydrogenase subunit G|nr:carbon monoxide dehydrogenase subunit G [Ktedonobacterales bacterium]